MRIGDVKLRQIRFQHQGGRFLQLQRRQLLWDPQEPWGQGGDIRTRPPPPPRSLPPLVASHFLAILSILSFFFIRGREVLEMVVSTKEEVD